MEPIGGEVRRELRRFGPQGGMAELLEAWPAAVGPEVARNAWPARIGRDGTVHVHTADSIWAFELAQRAGEIAARLGVRGLRFAAGPLPERVPEGQERRRRRPPEPLREHLDRAAVLVAAMTDDKLREQIARAVALSLARAPSSRGF